ncbi:MAG: hypothetical protein Q7R98_03475 [Candidatus Jorgensenbacteria bacterium]|nr:hypothetical protein [Candidatus Jorgensenbacteria bacterium]
MKNFPRTFFVVVILVFELLTTHYSLQTVRAFIGPTQSAGTGGGLFSVDSNLNIGFGTTAPSPVSTFNTTSTESGSSSHGYVFIVASTTSPGVGVKNLTSGHSYIWSARNFGNLQLYRESGAPDNLPGFVVMDINKFGSIGIGIKATSTGVDERLIVGGDIRTVNGAFRGTGAYLSSIDAANVLGGPFTTANYAFPLGLAVGTSTTSNLPATFYTLGTTNITGTTTLATTAGNVGIGTSTPVNKLDVIGSASIGVNTWGGLNFPNAKLIIAGAAVGPATSGTTTNGLFRIWSGNTNGALDMGVALSSPYGAWLQGYDSSNLATEIPLLLNPNGGNVGIATTSPSYKFEVNGTSYFSQPVVVGTPVGDSDATTKSYVDSAISGGSAGLWLLNGSTIYASSTAWKVGIATTSPTEYLEVGPAGSFVKSAIIHGNLSAGVYYDVADSSYYFDPDAGQMPYSLTTSGAVGIATTTPTNTLSVEGTFLVTGTSSLNGNLSFGGAAITNLNMNNNNLVGVNKITAATIDPLYEIDGKKYSTYASAIAGGVREEFIGRATLVPTMSLRDISRRETNSYEHVIDFSKVEVGSDLWVWKNAVDFSADNVDVFATPIGVSAPVSYAISGNKVIFSAQLLTTHYSLQTIPISFRLVGKRFDWKNWPTLAKDQNEKASFIIK